MLSDKYIAGFLDADGSVQIGWRKVDRADSRPELKTAYLSLEFSQREDQDKILYLIQKRIGGVISQDKTGQYSSLKVFGKQAVKALNRILKHLVIKRHIASVCLDMNGRVFNRKEAKTMLKAERRKPSLPLPNFPTRQWLAGYTDGDGCFTAFAGRKDTTGAMVQYTVVASNYDCEGLDIIHKNFGGCLGPVGKKLKHLQRLTIYLEPSKAKKFLGYFAKHLVKKKDQAMFILGCAEMGHYRDGRSIAAVLKQLKAHPHRLSDSEINVVDLVEGIDASIETKRIKDKRTYEENGGCIRCGSSTVPYYSDGHCRRCYDQVRWSKRQSDKL